MSDFPVRAPRARKIRNIEKTVSTLLTGVAFNWRPPIAGSLTFSSENEHANLSIDVEPTGVDVLIEQGIPSGDNQDITLVAAGDGGTPKAKITVRFTGQIAEATAPAKPTISLIPGDGEVEAIIVNGAANGAAITHHRIYTGPAADELVGSAPVVASTSHIVPAANGEEIFIAVAAINDVGEGPLSDVKSTTPVAVEDPEIELPEAVINQLAKTISLTSTPGGVTYTVWTIDNTLVGTLNSGNSHTISIASTAALPVRVRATDGVATVWSGYYLLDQAGLFSLGDFAGFADNADFTETVINGATPFTRNPSNGETLGGAKIDGGILKLFKKTPTFSYAVAADGEQPARAKMAFWGRVGIQSTTDGNANYRNVNINVGGANGTYLNLRFQQGQWYLTVRKTGGGGATTSGSWTSVLTDGDFIALMPVWSEDGTAIYYQLYIEENGQLKPQITGRGFLIPSADAANMTGTGFTLGNDLNNNSASSAMDTALASGWRWWYAIGTRGMTGSEYSLNTATFAAPDMLNPARINWRAWYSGTRTETRAALFDLHSGAMLSDFQTVANVGAGDTGTHTIGFDPAKGGGRNIALALYDPTDPSGTFSVITIGYAPHFPVMPLRSQQILGSQSDKTYSADYWNDRWKLAHGFKYLNSSGNQVFGFGVDTTGVISAEAWAAGCSRISLDLINGKYIGEADADKVFTATLNFPAEYCNDVRIGVYSGVTGPSGTGAPTWNPTTREIKWKASPNVPNRVTIQIVHATRPTVPLADGARFNFPTLPEGADPEQLFSTQYIQDFGNGGAIRLTQMCGTADDGTQVFSETWPHVDYPVQVREPADWSRMGAEMNAIINFVMQPMESNARFIEWAIEAARRLKAYETNPATNPAKISQKQFMLSMLCEPWNFAVPYGNEMKQGVKNAAEAGFFNAKPGGFNLILDHIDRYYLRPGSGYMALQHDLTAGQIVLGVVYNNNPNRLDNDLCIVECLADAPAGTPTPNPGAVGNVNSDGKLRVLAIHDTIQDAFYRWRTWMLGHVLDCFRFGTCDMTGKGMVPDLSGLSDESVALGRDRILGYVDTGPAHSGDEIVGWLMSGGTGTEYWRKLAPYGIGANGYVEHVSSISAAPTAGTWQADFTANDFASAFPKYMTYRTSLVAATISRIKTPYHRAISLLGQANVPVDERPELYLYEGGDHRSATCGGGLSQALKLYNFWYYVDQQPEYQAWYEDLYTKTMNVGVSICFPYEDYGYSLPVDGLASTFSTLDFPGAHLTSDPTRPAAQVRYHAERAVIDGLGLYGAAA
jgi:hypothetical protein